MIKRRKKVKKKTRRKISFIRRHPIVSILLFCLVTILAGLITLFNFDGRQAADAFIFVDQAATDIRLPKDDGPHEAMTEWWYYSGHLTAENGRQFSYHYTIFAHKALVKHTLVHATLLDHKTLKTYSYEARIPGFHSAVLSDKSVLIGTDRWNITLNNGQDRLEGKADNWHFSLNVVDDEQVVFHDSNGLLDFQEAGESYYYTRPRMKSQGRLTLGDSTYEVTGESWFDHQWGNFRAGVLHWDWFGLQLNNETTLMLFALRGHDGREVYIGGTVTVAGQSTALQASDIQMIPLKYWTSPATSQSYPVSWSIAVEKHNINIEAHAIKEASEFDARESSYILYWEGPVKVTGTHQGQGFLEVKKANAAIAGAQ